MVDERCFADPRLARDQDHSPSTGCCLSQMALEGFEERATFE
jgi:hypothetical protein